MRDIEKKIDTALRAAGCHGYSARFEASSDEQVDSSVSILLHGNATPWALQLGSGYCGINEYGYKDGCQVWMRIHGIFRTKAQAIKSLCALLSAALPAREG